MERDLRLPALKRFAIAITVLNLLGQTVLGFEQSWAHLVTAVGTAYATELLLESLTAWATGARPRYLGGLRALRDFLLSPHITGCAVAMLLYANSRLMPVAFAAAVAIASKTIFRVRVKETTRHFLNPSNFGITATLLLFNWVGIAPPYQFTENLYGIGDWILPLVILCSGSFLNTKFTRKLPLIAGWLSGFVAQAVVRTTIFHTSTTSALLPMTGVAFLLFTFYMVTDPATTPTRPRRQVVFGATVALGYGVLMSLHVVFGLFFALTIVTAGRGTVLWIGQRLAVPSTRRVLIGAERSEA
jgi:hypothetical protein